MYDFENEPDPIQAEKIYAEQNKVLDQEIYTLQKHRMPSSVASRLEELQEQRSELTNAWDNYKSTRLKEWVSNWSQTQQAMNDRESSLDQAIFAALKEVQKLCLARADAACLRRETDLKYAEWGGLDHEERMSILGREVRVLGKVVKTGRGQGSQLAPDVLRLFTDFALLNPDLDPFIGAK